MILERTIMTSQIKIIEIETTGEIHIIRSVQYNKLNAINVTVYKGVHTRLYGQINGKLTIKRNAVVHLHGNAFVVDNQGGELYRY